MLYVYTIRRTYIREGEKKWSSRDSFPIFFWPSGSKLFKHREAYQIFNVA